MSMYKHTFTRHKTREVGVGNLVVGGDNPIWVQSMTTPDTHHLEATVAEIHRLEEAGCEIVRVTVPKPEDAAVLGEIKRRIKLPLIVDIHFDYKMALAALDHPIDKLRINPGNIGGMDRFRQVLRKAKDKGIPMRIGVNAGSLEREFAMKYGFPCPPAMVDSALRYIEIAESVGYHDMIVSLKSSDVLTVVEAYRLYAKQANYPTHIGVTEAGKAPYAVTKSACGLAPILLDGKGKGVIFKRGEIVRHVLEKDMVDALMEEIAIWEQEEAAKGTLQEGSPMLRADGRDERHDERAEPQENGRMRLPVLHG